MTTTSRCVRAFALGMIAGSFLTAGIVAAPLAKAEPDRVSIAYAATFAQAVCDTLDAYPSFEGIYGIAQAIVEDGLTSRQAGYVIALSVTDACPWHLDLLDRFLDSGRGALT